nr:tRNA (adenosine(37)-N6)-threonylcarbamoyltransferase complex dimerization subunit type 1 TsaB [Bacilli bacterium]
MTYLAIDTSIDMLSVALADEHGDLLFQTAAVMGKRHATLLHPLIDQMLTFTQTTMQDIQGVAVGTGPGSYTGVRIGVTAAKAFSYALEIPLFGFSSLEASAQRYACHDGHLLVSWNARRNEAYSGMFFSVEGILQRYLDDAKTSYQALAKQIALDQNLGKTTIGLIGDGSQQLYEALTVYQEELQAKSITFRIIDMRSTVYGEDLMRLAWPMWQAKLATSREDAVHEAKKMVPSYLQLAQAEAEYRAQATRRDADV